MTVTLVIGKTCSGKTTYIGEHYSTPTGVYIDYREDRPDSNTLMEWVRNNPNETVIIEDVANQYIREIGLQTIQRYRNIHWVFSALRENDVPRVLRHIANVIHIDHSMWN